MAKVLGEKARYVTQHSIKKSFDQFLATFIVFYFYAFALGFFGGQRKTLIIFLFLIGFIPIHRLVRKITELIEGDNINFRKGASGEEVIGYILEGLPDDYSVIHDVKIQYGNLDHVVVGPSGVYVIDAKNWKGLVTSDGKGEILLNGKPTDKKVVNNQWQNVKNIKDQIKNLSSLDPFVQGVLAFPLASVDAKWGTTGYIHCVTDDKLYDYIAENKNNNKLSKEEIDSISHAFLALAKKDNNRGQA